MSRCTRRCGSRFKRLLLSLAFAFFLVANPVFAQAFKADARESASLTTYLRQHRLPLVGAQVLMNGRVQRRIVLYGFVASQYGKNDAVRQALAFVENGSPAGTPAPEIENRIEIRPEIARMKTQGAPASAYNGAESLDQVLNDIERYGVTMAPAGPNPK